MIKMYHTFHSIMTHITLLGGDERMLAVAHLLQAKGASLRTYGLPPGAPGAVTSLFHALTGARIVILPLPVTRDGEHPVTQHPPADWPTFDTLFARLEDEVLLLGGHISPALSEKARTAGVELCDYYRSERLLRQNARATAEAAVAMASLALPVVLADAPLGVVGYGRIGRDITALLLAHGARVTVYARSEDARRAAEEAGARACPIPPEGLMPDGELRAVFHTAPARLFTRAALSRLAPGTLLYDLSGGSVDEAAAEEGGILCPPAGGLPGRYAPESAGRYLYEAVTDEIRARRGIAL